MKTPLLSARAAMTLVSSFLASIGPAFSGEIHDAAGRNELAVVKSILNKTPNLIHSRDGEKRTPLHKAARFGDKKLVAYLLSKGADVNARCYNNFTPLHLVSDPEIAELLVNSGADLKARAATGTPIEDAVGNENVAIIEILLKAGEELDFDSLVRLNRTREALALIEEKPWIVKPPRECLSPAIRNGNMDLVKVLLEHGADPNFGSIQSVRITALSTAMMQRNYEAAELLFEHGARPDVSAFIGKLDVGLVEYAVGLRDIRFIKLVLAHGGDVNTWSRYGKMTPLHSAAQMNDLDKIKLLIEYEADINADSGDGVTPLFCAALRRNRETCKFLLSRGARLDFYSACALGKKVAVESMLMKNAKCATTKDKRLRREPIFYAAIGGSEEIMDLLLRNGANINAKGPEYDEGSLTVYLGSSAWKENIGETPLHVACAGESVSTVQFLLDRGADIAATDNSGDTPLHRGVRAGRLSIVQLLLNRNANANAKNQAGSTPWINADFRNKEMISVLLAAMPNEETLSLALSLAVHWQEPETARLLIEKGAQADMAAACSLGITKRVSELLKTDASLVNTGAGQYPPMYLAAQFGHVQLMDLLIQKGATISGSEHYSPLSVAAENGHLPAVELLLSKGAKIDSQDWRGSALHHAAGNDQLEVVKYLLDRKANLMALDLNRATALHAAADGGATNVIGYLVEQGIPIEIKDMQGDSPLHRAASSAKPPAVSVLLQLGADDKVRNFRGKTPLELANQVGAFPFEEDDDGRAATVQLLNKHAERKAAGR